MPGKIRARILIVISLAFLLAQCCASENSFPQDTTKKVSPVRRDTLAAHMPSFETVKDSLIRIKPIPLIGALEPYGDSSEAILGSQIPWIEYRYMGDLLWTKPGMYIRDMGSPGQHNELTVGGVDDRGIAFLVDGRSQADPITGTYDMILFPTDYIERIEFITGPRAMLYGMNSTGGAINIVTKSFYTNKPYSRIRYSQGVDDYAQTDAMFSQNIFSRFNFMFGLERHALGYDQIDQDYRGRFVNSDYDAWSFRTKLRYDISNSFNIVFSHLYEQAMTGMFGGVNYVQTTPDEYFNEQVALVSNNEAYEKIYNHHLDLTAAGHLTGDTMQVTTLTAYYSNQLREYRDEVREYPDGLPFNGVLTHSDNRSSNAGLLLRHEIESTVQNFSLTAEAEEIQVESSPEVGGHKENKFSGSAKEEVLILSPLTFAVFGRDDYYRDQNLPGAGADAQLSINPSLSLFGGMSVSQRTPTLQELYWSSDSTQLPTPRLWLKNEHHTLIQVGTRFSIPDVLSGTISLTHREIKNPILVDTTAGTSPVNYTLVFSQPALNIYNGVDVSLKASYDHFFAEGNATYLKQPDYYHADQKLQLLPELYLDGSFYYKNELANGNLELKIGFRGRYTSSQSGMAPLDESGLYVPYVLLQSFGPSGTADFFVIGKLGDAYIHFIWENLSGNQYMLTPFYPMYDRNVRFGVSWEFWN
ncbi:MAG: putative porin [Bacteroidota bacterium]